MIGILLLCSDSSMADNDDYKIGLYSQIIMSSDSSMADNDTDKLNIRKG